MPTLYPKITTLCLLWLIVWPLRPVYGQQQVFSCSPPKYPLMVQSNEADRDQLAFAKAEGDSVDKCIDWVLEQAGARSGRLHAGEYIITYAITEPEGWYMLEEGSLSWYKPASTDNAHLWIFVQDASDHRIVPGLIVKAELVDLRGSSIFDKTLPYGLAPLVNGYSDNLRLPMGFQYQLFLSIAPPRYSRHDPYNGDRFTSPVKCAVDVKVNRDHLGEIPLSEAMEKRLDLARAVGNAYKKTLKAMYRQATDGKDTVQGDYFVAFADEYGEGYWHYGKNKKLTYLISQEQSAVHNAHVEVAICDAKTGRFMHDLAVTATLYNGDKEVGSKDEAFMWHPWLHHYGENWRVPHSGRKYSLQIEARPPSYRRYGRQFGKQFTRPVSARFTNIRIKTGEK